MPLNIFLHLIDKIYTNIDKKKTKSNNIITNSRICLDKHNTSNDLDQFIYKFTFTF